MANKPVYEKCTKRILNGKLNVYSRYQMVFKMYTNDLLRIYIYDILKMYYSWLVD